MDAEQTRPRIAFLTALDVQAIRTWSWSGVFTQMVRALERTCDVSVVGPINCKEQVIARGISKAARIILRKNYPRLHSVMLSKRYGRVAAQWLAGQRFDAIIAPAGETEIAFLETDIPIVLVEDATYGQLIGYHPDYSNLTPGSARELWILEAEALRRASAVVASTTWAARSAIADFHTDERKVHVVSFGANFDTAPTSEVVRAKKKPERCTLLFVGGIWDRKGGDIAFETLERLCEMGIDGELIVVGCTPPPAFSHPRMTVIPFLDKSNPEDLRKFEELYLTSAFALLPTRNECSGIAFCEASAFGLPVISTDTGGVSDVVHDGESGYLLPYSARGDAYAALIAEIFRDEERYTRLTQSSRQSYEQRHMSWDAWGESVLQIISSLQ